MSGAALYLVLILLTLGVCWYGGVDHDPGGYAEGLDWATFRQPPQLAHAGISLALTIASALAFGLRGLAAALLTLLAGLGWEVMQRFPRDGSPGYLSRADLACDAAGCLVGWGVLALLGRG